MADVTTPERPRQRVTLTIPAAYIDDFRVGLLADLKSDTEGFGVEHANMLDAKPDRRAMCREDRDGRIPAIRDSFELLAQLPDDDREATISGTVEAFRFALEDAGRQLTACVRDQFQYCPVPVEDVLPLLDRLRWTIEQIASTETVA